jgi:hypothetical protein
MFRKTHRFIYGLIQRWKLCEAGKRGTARAAVDLLMRHRDHSICEFSSQSGDGSFWKDDSWGVARFSTEPVSSPSVPPDQCSSIGGKARRHSMARDRAQPEGLARSQRRAGSTGSILPRREQKRVRELLTQSRELLKQLQAG